MQFPAFLRGLLTHLSLFLVDIPPHPVLFLCQFGRITTPIFSKSRGYVPPRPPVAPLMTAVVCLSLPFHLANSMLENARKIYTAVKFLLDNNV